MIKQCTIIFACLAAGELIVYFTGIHFPASIIGMLLLTFLLKSKVIPLHAVKTVADFLAAHIAFFLIPAGVAVILYLDLLRQYAWPILMASILSTVLTLLATGWIHQGLRKTLKQRK